MLCNRLARLGLALVFVCPTLSQNIWAQTQSPDSHSRHLSAPLSFEANQGQADASVQFLARGSDYNLTLSRSGIALQLRNQNRESAQPTEVTMDLVQPGEPSLSGEGLQGGKSNYFIGNDPSRWVTNVANFSRVRYRSVYPGTDLIFYGQQNLLEYDFRLNPGADPGKIQFNVAGAKPRVDESGNLTLATSSGEITWRKPVAYQVVNGQKREVACTYDVSGARVGFQMGKYDRTSELVIDPPLVWGSFLGGSNSDNLGQVQVDQAGELVVAGTTLSGNFPTSAAAFDRNYTGSSNGLIFVTKFSPDGRSLVYSTFVGGTGSVGSTFTGLAVDAQGNAYVSGYSNQTDFPYTPGSYHYGNGTFGSVLFKLNSSGSALTYSASAVTFGSVAVDAEGAAYVAGGWGYVPPAPYPFTKGAYHNQVVSGVDYISVIKYNPGGTALDYAALIGSSGLQQASGITVDSAGEATIGGHVYTKGYSGVNYPVTAGEPQGIGDDALVTKFNSAGTALVYSLRLAAAAGFNIAGDSAGNVAVVGTASPQLPTTSNAYEPKFPSSGSGIHQSFATRIDPTGQITYSTFLGGNIPNNTAENAYSVAMEESTGILDITGGTQSTTFPMTDKTYFSNTCGYLARINPAASGASSLLYSGCISTFLNPNPNLIFIGGGIETGTVATNGNGLVYLGFNNAGPTMMNAFQPFSRFSTGPVYFNYPQDAWVGEMNFAQRPQPQSVVVHLPPNGVDYSSPVHYVADATTTCKAGVAAMGIYTSSGVLAYSTTGNHLDTRLTLKPGIYDTVVQEWDNCGGSDKTPVSVRVELEGVIITSPAKNSTVSSPVHFVATATNSYCPNQDYNHSTFSGLRLYTAPGVDAYDVYNTNKIDTELTLSPGTYNVVVQAWDYCQNVFKAPVTITVK